MRSIEEFKKRQLEELPQALARPSMWCGHLGAENSFRSMLSDLCWIDDREADWKRAKDRFLWGSSGVIGHLTDQPIVLPEYGNEVASSYAEIAHALGYFQPARQLSGSEWADLRNALDNNFFARDWQESQIHARFGSPSHEVLGGLTTVACYSTENTTEPWVFFDLARKPPHADGWLSDPVLRDVRIRNNVFHLLPSADWCRRYAAYFPTAIGPGKLVMYLGMVSLEGDHLAGIPQLLRDAGYRIEESFAVYSSEQVAKEIAWSPGGRQTAKAAYSANGWTHILDPEMSLPCQNEWLKFTLERGNRVLGWGCCDHTTTRALTLFQTGKRLRDIVYCHGGVVVDRGDPLTEEAGIKWSEARAEDVLAIAARFGAPFDFPAEREYLIFRVDAPGGGISWY